jgi:hypothetical protein
MGPCGHSVAADSGLDPSTDPRQTDIILRGPNPIELIIRKKSYKKKKWTPQIKQ